MKKDPRIHVSFILECIELVEEYLKGLTETEFLNSTQQQDAIIRRVELIGEAMRISQQYIFSYTPSPISVHTTKMMNRIKNVTGIKMEG